MYLQLYLFVFVAVFVFVFVCICEDEDQGSGYPGLVRPLRRFTATNLPARGPRALLLLLLLEVIMDSWCHLAILESSNLALGPRALLQVSNWRSSGHLASSHLLVTIDHTVIQENLFWGLSLLELAIHPFFLMCIDAQCAYLHNAHIREYIVFAHIAGFVVIARFKQSARKIEIELEVFWPILRTL